MTQDDYVKLLVEKAGVPLQVAKKLVSQLVIAQIEFGKKNYQKASHYYKEAIVSCPYLAKIGFHMQLTNSLILSVDWDTISQNIPAGINYLQSSGWLKTLVQTKPVNQNSDPIPWYSYPAIEFIESILKKEFIVFEYGTGQSTFWWAERVRTIFTVEHDPEWFYQLKNIPQNIRANLIESEKEYAKEILRYPDHCFDCIVIDGVNRNLCANSCFEKLKETGFIIFDNTDKQENHEGVIFLMSKGFKRIDFYGLIPCYTYKTCTSIFFINDGFLSQQDLPGKKQSCLGMCSGQITNL